MTETKEIPQVIAERYLSSLTGYVSTVRNAIAAMPGTSQSAVWQQRVLPVLESRLATTQMALTHSSIGNHQPLADSALQSLSLARDIDGYATNFAGKEFAAQLEEKLRMVVFAAWQVCQSAGAV